MKRLRKNIPVLAGPAQLSFMLGGLSVIALIQESLNFGLSSVLTDVICEYEKLISALLAWVLPIAELIVELIQAVYEVELRLINDWKHVFVIFGIYIYRNAVVSFSMGAISTGVFRICWGTLVCLSLSLFIGLLPELKSAALQRFLVAASFPSALLCYRVGYQVWAVNFLVHRFPEMFRVDSATVSKWSQLLELVRRDVVMFWVSVVLILIVLSMIPNAEPRVSGLLIGLGYVFLLAVYFLYDGYSRAVRATGKDVEFEACFKRQGATKLGFSMLYVFIYSFFFCISNVAFELVGI